MRKLLSMLFALGLVISAVPAAVAQNASPEASAGGAASSLLAELGYTELTITTDGASFDLPSEIEAGRYRIVLDNSSDSRLAAAQLYKIPEGMTFDDLMTAFSSVEDLQEPPDIFYAPGFSDGGVIAPPGTQGDVVVDLTPGIWAFNFLAGAESEELNLLEELQVTGDMPERTDPAVDVEVGMVEMKFVMPETVAAGPGVWRFSNDGGFPHEIIISNYPEPVSRAQVEATLAMEFGMPVASPTADGSPVVPLDLSQAQDVFTSFVISPGNVNWHELDLAPGTYIALCFVAGPGDVPPHALMGMFKIITVE